MTLQYNKMCYANLTEMVISSVSRMPPIDILACDLSWHFCEHARNINEFRDFVLTRISEVELLEDEVNDEVETLQWDKQWNRIVELELIPHPKLAHPEAVSMDYAMQNNRLRVEIRAAFAGYLLRLWNIDCSKNSKSNGREFHLALKNPEALYGVDNASLAPGYSES